MTKIITTKKYIYRYMIRGEHIWVSAIINVICTFMIFVLGKLISVGGHPLFSVSLGGMIINQIFFVLYFAWLEAKDNRRPNTPEHEAYKIP